MFRKEDRSAIPFHDDNKYAKSPFSMHTKAQPRLRLRKRHAVLVLCLVAATYLFLKSPSASVSFKSNRPSFSSLEKNGGGDPLQGQVKKNVDLPISPPKGSNSNSSSNRNSNGADTSGITSQNQAKKQEEKKKKKKKKAPPTLFEFDGKDEKLSFQDVPIPNKSKSKGQERKRKAKAPSPPPAPGPGPGVPVVPVPPVIKQQHDWKKENEDKNHSNQPEKSSAEVGSSETDTVADDTVSSPSYRGNRFSNGSSSTTQVNPQTWQERKNRVKQAFVSSWNAYKRDAWGKDEYHPVNKYGSNIIRKGEGLMIVDSLDTMLLMGLEDEFQEAKAWVRDELDFDQDGEVNLFETTIRVLGGLLSAYDQSSQDPVFLRKAVDLADRLMGAFETTSGIPYANVHLKDRRGIPNHNHGISSTAGVATLQLEFKYLTHVTGDSKYWKAVENVVLKMKELDNLDGLVPIYINPYTGRFQGGEISLGSRGDSYYEYLIKQYLQTGKKENIYKDMYDHAIGGVKKHLLGRTIPNNLLFVGEISKYEPQNLAPKMDHLACFLGGSMALASTEGHPLNEQTSPRSRFSTAQEENFKIAEDLTESCYEMYHQTETGLAPEIVYWVQKEEQIRGKSALQHAPGSDFIINDRDSYSRLRPETIESLFYLWRLTGEEKYRHWGWNIFEAIEKYSKVATGGYSSIDDIRRADKIKLSDEMETFFLAETLKYLYLLFGSDDVLPLDKYVFNTEAHPLPIFTPSEELLARTATYTGSNNGKEETKEETVDQTADDDSNKRYKDLISKEDDDRETVADGYDDEDDQEQQQEDESADDEDSGMKVEDAEEFKNDDEITAETDLEDEEASVDEVDQGLEDLAVDTGEDEEAEMPEVEVDYEDNTNDPDQEEDTGEDGEDNGEETEAGNEENEAEDEEGEEGEEDEEEEEEEEEQDEEAGDEEEDEEGDEPDVADDYSTEEGGDDYGVVKPENWEGQDTTEEEEPQEGPSYNDHDLL
ncbi:mannosyl-oligosaccharide alpha-1,2-mannosidase [Mortierella sp. GBA30]|nr:mannosyl-oligosaccharide alpha-1,2-mannosidase [Mortierella sp. GBA30]